MINTNNNIIPWIEKYRPKKLSDMQQSTNLIDLFKNNIKSRDMTHCLFYGPPGTGKTSAILAIGREIFKEFFSSRVIEFNASDDRGINAVREKITKEAKKKVTEMTSIDGTIIPSYKIIILDEADSMTDEAQDALRVIIEQYSAVTRFCFICNYISKITDAIKSRCSLIYFKKLNVECVTNKLNEISKLENMKLTSDNINCIIEVSNGDMRKAIMLLQNLKYVYKYQLDRKKKICDLTFNELKYLYLSISSEKKSNTIDDNVIYDIAASISFDEAQKILLQVLNCKNIVQLSILSKDIIAKGYPIDNILNQINKIICETDIFDDLQKAKIINYSGKIFFRIQESANEYIQLLDYLSCIRGVKLNISVYQ